MRHAAVLLILAAGLAAAEVLTPLTAGRQQLNDALGCIWDIDPQSGMVNDGSDDCFDGGLMLMVNGQQFRVQQAMQTKDGEMVLQANDSDGDGVAITRRIRLERQLNVVRYLEILTNTSQQSRSVTLMVQSNLGGNAQSVVTTSGTAFSGGALGPKDHGLFAFQQPNSSRPSVLFILSAPKAPLQPQVTCADRRQFSFQYQVTIPAGQRVAVVHMVGQRRGQTDPAKEAAVLLKALPKMGMTPELMRLVQNIRLRVEAEVVVGGLPALDRWCEAHGVTRGGEDLLLTGSGDGQQARGAVRGQGVTIASASGKQVVPLAEVAAVIGGAGAGAPGRVFLRSGEILCGMLSAPDLALVAGGGSLAVDPATTPGLVLRGDRRDGQDAGAGLVALPDGDQLSLASEPAAMSLVGAAGVVPVDFSLIAAITRQRGDRFGWEVTWGDGSKLSGFLDGKPLALATRRRGALTLPVHEVEGFLHPARKPPQELERFDHAELIGGDRLVGAFAGPSLSLAGRAGPVTVESAKVASLVRNEEGQLVVELVGGGQVVGGPEGTGLAVARPGGPVSVPWRLVERWVKAEKDEAAPPTAAPPDPRLAVQVGLQVTDVPLAEAAAKVAGAIKVTLAFGAGIDPKALPLRTVAVDGVPASAALDALLRDTGFGYRLEGDRLLIEQVAEPGEESTPAEGAKP